MAHSTPLFPVWPFRTVQSSLSSGQLQPRDPTFGASLQGGDVLLQIECVTNANHSSNLRQPEQAANAINRFVYAAKR